MTSGMQVRRGSDRARLRAALARRFTGDHDITESIPFANFRALAETICQVRLLRDGTVSAG